ncbi:di-heme-cytochrome C peroxidase [Rhodospirillum sp. A1_3_36]|uniref:di-heme-cytochrome C peroxidase n=1 Tax=Rhodospirillum sp. A1_3_36 TaxID=3391666 RepID=UPI0039A5AB3D
MKRIFVVATASVALAACSALSPPDLPANPPFTKAVWLSQNWTPDERFWFHHSSQGTSTFPLPYNWFVALEQPEISLLSTPKPFIDPDYLAGFGFIPSPKSPEGATAYGYTEEAGTRVRGAPGTYDLASFGGNPDGLPVGFAITKGYVDPETGETIPDQVGLSCAACHTGHMVYKGTSLRVDGAPAITNLDKFSKALGLAVVFTDLFPSRFNRFANKLLGPDHTSEQKKALKKQLGEVLKNLGDQATLFNQTAKENVEEGFGRLDALNRIGNQVFVLDLKGATDFDSTVNLAATDAPVNYPQTWDTSWFQWVQYDGSIMQPMVRNAGEALGVTARVNLSNPDRTLYASSVPVDTVFHMEDLLAGSNPLDAPVGFKGLESPKWPEEILGEITGDIDRGKALYQAHCQSCHLPPVNDPDRGLFKPTYWTKPNGVGESYLKLPLVPIDEVGTDPAEAAVLVNRTVKVPGWLGVDPKALCDGPGGETVTETSFAAALGFVVQATINRWYDDHGVPTEERNRMNGNRPNCLQAKMIYKARPLNGIWATAPYLHNGSVPNLYSMLLPPAERPKTFCLGNRTFDPDKVGYVTDCEAGATVIDTTIKGNLNIGHAFMEGPLGDGIIGPPLTEPDRKALVAYLKTL